MFQGTDSICPPRDKSQRRMTAGILSPAKTPQGLVIPRRGGPARFEVEQRHGQKTHSTNLDNLAHRRFYHSPPKRNTPFQESDPSKQIHGHHHTKEEANGAHIAYHNSRVTMKHPEGSSYNNAPKQHFQTTYAADIQHAGGSGVTFEKYSRHSKKKIFSNKYCNSDGEKTRVWDIPAGKQRPSTADNTGMRYKETRLWWSCDEICRQV